MLVATPHTPSPSPPLPSSPGSLSISSSDSTSSISLTSSSDGTPIPFILLSSPIKPSVSYVGILSTPSPSPPHSVLASSQLPVLVSPSPRPLVPTRALSLSTSSSSIAPPQPFFSPSNLASPTTTAFHFPSTPPPGNTSTSSPRSIASSSSSSTPKFVAPVGPRERERERRQSLQISSSAAQTTPRGEPPRDRRQSQKAYGSGPVGLEGVATRVRKQSQIQRPQQFGSTSPPATSSSGSASTTDANSTNQLEAKVVILGSQGAGKTSIVHRATSGVFSRSPSSTLGASFLTKRLVVDGCKVRLQIWDTAGQERFRSMAPLYYRGALAAILVYDISNLQSFYDVKIWLDELRRNMSPDLIIHVVGSKSDLVAYRQVDLTFARRTIAQWLSEGVPAAPSPREISPRPRTRTMSTRAGVIGGAGAGALGGSLPSSVSMPSIASAAVAPVPASSASVITTPGGGSAMGNNTHSQNPSIGSRVRRMSNKFKPPSGLSPSTPGTPTSGTANASSSAGLVSNDLAASSNLEGITRSGSRLSLGFGLGLGASRGGRRSYDEGRRTAEELENERLDELVRDCGVAVTEASAEDDEGIEDIFLLITQRLVDRKAQIESERVLRSRDSVMLTDVVSPSAAANSSWCC